MPLTKGSLHWGVTILFAMVTYEPGCPGFRPMKQINHTALAFNW